jgi:hypothetical protein
MRRVLVTVGALAALAATAAGAVHVTAREARVVCLPPAVVQAWS